MSNFRYFCVTFRLEKKKRKKKKLKKKKKKKKKKKERKQKAILNVNKADEINHNLPNLVSICKSDYSKNKKKRFKLMPYLSPISF